MIFCRLVSILFPYTTLFRSEGYWHNPEATTEMLRNGRLYTGDLGLLDGDGYLTIVDRKKDLIKASGFQVWPREVEEVDRKSTRLNSSHRCNSYSLCCLKKKK